MGSNLCPKVFVVVVKRQEEEGVEVTQQWTEVRMGQTEGKVHRILQSTQLFVVPHLHLPCFRWYIFYCITSLPGNA